MYIFIDRFKADSQNSDLNLEVLRIANEYKSRQRIEILRAEENLGADKAVPTAVDWISKFEDRFIVLEDDCHLTPEGFEFLDNSINILNDEICMICATSPWDLDSKSTGFQINSISSYPLISGWATTSRHWAAISTFISTPPPYLKVVCQALKTPSKAQALCFFLAAQIRVSRGKLKAWDSSVALSMLMGNKKSIVPNITMVTNTGRDAVATHTIPKEGEDEIFRYATKEKPSTGYSTKLNDCRLTDQEIEQKLYGFRVFNYLSPFKALIGR